MQNLRLEIFNFTLTANVCCQGFYFYPQVQKVSQNLALAWG